MKNIYQTKKWFAFTACLLFISIACYPTIQGEIEGEILVIQSTGNTLYVGGSGPSNYTSIQDAINASTDGDTVFVYSGMYQGNITIDKKNIKLIGENRDTTIINGSNASYSTATTDYGILLLDYCDSISGFTIQNFRSGRMGFPNFGIAEFGEESDFLYLNISNCKFKNNEVGFFCLEQHYRNSKISDCIFLNHPGFFGGLIVGGDNISITNCHFLNNDNYDPDSGSGMPCASMILTNSSIYNCNFSNNEDGLWVVGGNDTVTNCIFSNNNASGLNIDGDKINVSNCSIYNNSGEGISAWPVVNSSITNCNIFGNKIGVNFSYSHNNKIEYCNISNNRVGIQSNKDSSNILVGSNNIFDNIIFGVNNTLYGLQYEINASLNWWSSSDGPGPIADGSGDNVSDNVIFEPWLTEPAGPYVPPVEPESNIQIEIEKGFSTKIKVIIKNTGDKDASNIGYSVSVKGGMLDGINESKSGNISTLVTGGSKTVEISVFGFGITEIKARADTVVSKTRKSLILGNLVIVL